ncbi:hypothetical protein GT347_15055 [Xylophilus rhododendri]|uniref:Uncharacterized protein n=1 Tax=Xylophilus rhododendri TaxID=2697032 RepID=A0A857J7Y5_9BURK|nr:hypothetical protein [Xylophilus rhododendri]QHI99179.1 hypothetical protein GT347_15055 [Xylophilus rhododendri]
MVGPVRLGPLDLAGPLAAVLQVQAGRLGVRARRTAAGAGSGGAGAAGARRPGLQEAVVAQVAQVASQGPASPRALLDAFLRGVLVHVFGEQVGEQVIEDTEFQKIVVATRQAIESDPQLARKAHGLTSHLMEELARTGPAARAPDQA